LRGRLSHSSSKLYGYRLKYVMGPLQKLAYLTPWADENLLTQYFYKLDLLYKRWLPKGSVLDIGSGPGHLSRKFLGDLGVNFYMGLDYSATMAKDAKSTYPNELFIAGDTRNLPCRDSSFDIVHSTRLFHHLPPKSRTGVILEQLRVAKRTLIIEDLFGFANCFWQKPHYYYYTIFDRSYYRYTLEEWWTLFNSLNLNVAEHIHTDKRLIQGRCACWVITL
jgi:SAM-dependent methyltransferase